MNHQLLGDAIGGAKNEMSLIKRGKKALEERKKLQKELKAIEKQAEEEVLAKAKAVELTRKRAAAKAKGAKKGAKKAKGQGKTLAKKVKKAAVKAGRAYVKKIGATKRSEFAISFLPQAPEGYRVKFKPPGY